MRTAIWPSLWILRSVWCEHLKCPSGTGFQCETGIGICTYAWLISCYATFRDSIKRKKTIKDDQIEILILQITSLIQHYKDLLTKHGCLGWTRYLLLVDTYYFSWGYSLHDALFIQLTKLLFEKQVEVTLMPPIIYTNKTCYVQISS